MEVIYGNFVISGCIRESSAAFSSPEEDCKKILLNFYIIVKIGEL